MYMGYTPHGAPNRACYDDVVKFNLNVHYRTGKSSPSEAAFDKRDRSGHGVALALQADLRLPNPGGARAAKVPTTWFDDKAQTIEVRKLWDERTKGNGVNTP